MHYHPITKQYVIDGEHFTHDGNRYPANWNKASLGFIEVTTVGTREDDRYFWVNEELIDGVCTIINTPKDPAQIAEMERAITKAEIDNLERTSLMPRAIRECTLKSMQATMTPEQLAADYGYNVIKLLDDNVTALRNTL